MKKAYVILTYPDTIPSRLIKMYTREPFSHTSFTFDETLADFYSFGRKTLYNIFNAGFICEHISKGIMARRDTYCRVCCITVTDEQYEIMKKTLQQFIDHPDDYKYNFGGFFAEVVHKSPKYDNKYFCSQFVAYVLESAGVDVVGKPYIKVKPKDFTDSKKMEIIYEGGMDEYPLQQIQAMAG